jgi:hypothetical protein
MERKQMIKTLVVSGCSFTMGGGLDNPNYHNLFESNALKEDGKTWNTKIAGRDGRKFCEKNNWGYYLHKLLNLRKENYKNFAIGGGGLFRSIQSIYTFIRSYDGNPSELQIIYQIPSVTRFELTEIHTDCRLFKSIVNSDEDANHLRTWVKYFQNTETDWLRTLLEVDKLNMMCKAKGIPLILIDWNREFTKDMTRTMISMLMKQNDNSLKSLYRQITDNHYDKASIPFESIINDFPLFDVHKLIKNPKNRIHTIVDDEVVVIDNHLDPNGAKLLGNYIFKKKFKEN